MEQNLSQFVIILVAITNLGALVVLVLHVLANYWENQFDENMQKAVMQSKEYSQIYQEGGQFLSRCIREEPYKDVTQRLSKNLLAMAEEIDRLNQVQEDLNSATLDSGENSLRHIVLFVLVSPFFCRQKYLKSQKLLRDGLKLAPYAQAVKDAQAEVAQVGVKFYDRVQILGSRLIAIEKTLKKLKELNIGGGGLDEARFRSGRLQKEFAGIPEVFRVAARAVAADFDPLDVKIAQSLLINLEKESNSLHGLVSDWDARILFLQGEILRLKTTMEGVEKLVGASDGVSHWENLDVERMRIVEILKNFNDFPTGADIDQLDAIYEQLDPLNRAASGLSARVQKTIADARSLEILIDKIVNQCSEVSSRVEEGSKHAIFPIQWETSGQQLEFAKQVISQMSSNAQISTPATIEKDLGTAQSLYEIGLPAIAASVSKILDFREQLIEMREALKGEKAKNWLIQTENLISQIHYDLANFPDQHAFIGIMVGQARELEAEIHAWLMENPANAMLESQAEPNFERLKKLLNGLQNFKQNWILVDRRLVDLKHMESDITALQLEGRELYADLRALSNLRLMPDGILGPMRNLDRREEEVDIALKNPRIVRLEDKLQLVNDWVREISESGYDIYEQLNKLVMEKQTRLADLIQRILKIANVNSEKMIGDWKTAVKMAGPGGADTETHPHKKFAMDQIQEQTALLHNLNLMIENAEKKCEFLREVMLRTDRERKFAIAVYGEAAKIFEEKWPPTRESLEEINKMLAELEYRWNNIPLTPAGFEKKIGELQDMEVQFKILGQKIKDVCERAQRDKQAITDMESQVVVIEKVLQNKLKNQPNLDPIMSSAIQLRLQQISYARRNEIKSAFLNSSPFESGFAKVDLEYRTLLGEAQQPVQVRSTLVPFGSLVSAGTAEVEVNVEQLVGNDVQKVIGYLVKIIEGEHVLPNADRIRARNELMGLQVELLKQKDADMELIQQRVFSLQKIAYPDRRRRDTTHNVLGLLIYELTDLPGGISSPTAGLILAILENGVRRP